MSTAEVLSPARTAVLALLVDLVIPEDESPGGWAGGVRRLLSEHGTGFMSWALPALDALVDDADSRARALGAGGFRDLSGHGRARVFAQLADSGSRLPLSTDDDRSRLTPFDALLLVAYEGYYGGTREPAGWSVAGFRPVPPGVVPIDPEPLAGIRPEDLQEHYDVVVVGAGAGGGAVAAELSEGGLHVLLVERSTPMRNSVLRGNHLQGKRLAVYDISAGPGAGSPRVVQEYDADPVVVPGDGPGNAYGLVAMTLGGGTRVWQGMSWRFFPEDFRMAETYGAPEESTLADWPFDYDELAPYYDRAEWELGVAGDGEGELGRRTPRGVPYPMPPLPDDATRRLLTKAAHDLGWATTAVPFAINSVPRAGRSACVRCSQCVGHACPVDAKNGSQNTFVPRALATGRADLLMRSQVVAVLHDGRGRATGVRMVTGAGGAGVERTVHADRVVVAAGALETPRLLLASGLGNEWVGRNHHSHGLAIAIAGRAPSGSTTDIGPGHSVATLDLVHRHGEAWGGGVLFDLLPSYPLGRALTGASDPARRFGAAHKAWMRSSGVPLGGMSMVQEIPDVTSRITLSKGVRDRYGMPVVHAIGRPHPATIEATEYMAEHAARWVEAAGGSDIARRTLPGIVQGSEHSAGTSRMALRPEDGACDAHGLLFGTVNVHVADASLHPTNGGFNPALTVFANALRVGRSILDGNGTPAASLRQEQ